MKQIFSCIMKRIFRVIWKLPAIWSKFSCDMKQILVAIWSEIFYIGHNFQFKANTFVWFEVNILVFLPYVTNFPWTKKLYFRLKNQLCDLKLVLFEVEIRYLNQNIFMLYKDNILEIWGDIPNIKWNSHLEKNFRAL